MTYDITLTDGRLGTEPSEDIKYSSSGQAMLTMRVASTRRYQDKQSGEWKDASTTWVNCVAYRNLAEQIAESLKKGDPVMGTGVYESREYQKDGETRTVYELNLQHFGLDLARAKRKDQSRQAPAAATFDEPPF